MRRVQGLKVGLCLVLGWGLSGNAFAKRNYGMAGCGPGSVVISPSGPQIFAGTTNGLFYSQGFAITSGTSNCLPAHEMALVKKQEEFLTANMNTLQKEMAQGQGETLYAFASLLGCPANLQKQASDTLVQGYQNIFKEPGVVGVLDTAKDELRKNEVLKTQCAIVG